MRDAILAALAPPTKTGRKRVQIQWQNGAAPPPATEANRLRAVWERLTVSHLLAGGCSCAAGGGDPVTGRMIEQDLLDYLDDRYRAAGEVEASRLLVDGAGFVRRERGDLYALLSAIAEESEAPPASQATLRRVVADIARTLDSLDETHRAR